MAAPGYPKRIYAYWYFFKVVHGCVIYHHNLGEYINVTISTPENGEMSLLLEIYKQKEDPWNFHKYFSWSFLEAPLIF